MAGIPLKPNPTIKIKPNQFISIPQGKLEGLVLQSRDSQDYYGFYGIPFAGKPERFAAPEKWESWSGTLDATKPRERSPQASLITKKVFGSENCLFANVFTPKLPPPLEVLDERLSGSKFVGLPVMVFIYGGGFYVGGGDLYGGKYLVDQNVIVVTFNYRLGALGFLNSGDGEVAGNAGLKDQVMCLKWVQEVIPYFDRSQEKMGQSFSTPNVFTQKEMEDYVDLTYFTKREIMLVYAKFKALSPEEVEKDKNVRLSMEKMLNYPELKVNPFGDRICLVFSSSKNGACTFEDFLDMMSVFSEDAPVSLKAEYAFRIFDFDGDDMLGPEDLEEIVKRLLGTDTLSDTDMTNLVASLTSDSDLDEDGTLSFTEFEHVVAKSSDFEHAFRMRL